MMMEYCLIYACMLSSCPTVCNPVDCSPPGSSVHGFSREEYCCGLPCPPPGDLPDPEIKLASPASSCIGRQILCQNHLGRHSLFDFQFLDRESSVNVSLLPVTLHMVSIQLRFLHTLLPAVYAHLVLVRD